MSNTRSTSKSKKKTTSVTSSTATSGPKKFKGYRSFGNIKCYLSFALLLYSILHIVFNCPLSQPYVKEGNRDLICQTSHHAYGYVSCYVDPVIDKVSTRYDNSRIKPFVDSTSESTLHLYQLYCKPIVDKYGPVVKSKADATTLFVKEKGVVITHRTFQITKHIGTECYEKSKQASLTVCKYIRTVAFPATVSAIKWTEDKFRYIIQKMAVWFYVNFNVYVHPKLEYLYSKFESSTAGQYWLQFQQSRFCKTVAYFINTVLSAISEAYISAREVICEFKKKELMYKLSIHYKKVEQKKDFLKSELGKFFSPGFKIPQYKDLQIFKNMSRRMKGIAETSDVADTDHSTTSVVSTTAVPEDEKVSILSSSMFIVDTMQIAQEVISEQIATSVSSSLFSSSVEQAASAAASASKVPDDIITSKKYEKLVDTVINGAVDDFAEQVAALSVVTAEKLKEAIKPSLALLSNKVTGGYSDIHTMLAGINGKKKEEEGYVSRQDYRDVLAKCASNMNSLADNVFFTLKEEESAYTDEVLRIRSNILETLAEFSDSTLAAYSTEIVNDGDDWEEWKRYNAIKKELLKARDEILEAKPPGEVKMFNDAARTVNILLKEGQSYLAIMRAKGNLEFQSREKGEREAAAVAQEQEQEQEGEEDGEEEGEEEEEIRIASTIIVYETMKDTGNSRIKNDNSKIEGTEASKATQETVRGGNDDEKITLNI
ncbi:hypothetical protein FOA43_003388 [Brettanomyces nanus]|uniref:Uncharacterized protein n=1 Tax=Eeniella nana TaxID=13502 RepID=A0A875S7V1_EENNA|nr:uncharacterized protein FOA43_003388 [Brettanomyces nanus]QPG76002.1 hypothetical protein FOA43_003388 [Brettanomyces nanus]